MRSFGSQPVRPVSMGFTGVSCTINKVARQFFLHKTGRREKGFVSWPRNLSALFPKLRKRRETCTEALPSFHRDFSSPGPCVLHLDSAGRGRRTVAGEAARRARSSAGRGRSACAGGSSAGRGRWTTAGEVAGRGRSSASRRRSAGAVRREPSIASCPVATPPATRPLPVAVAAGRGRREREGSARSPPCSASTPCSTSRR